ncbi:MAG TPA: hypothetical protein VJB12_02510, partial [Candidatus Nanoarchaeia archaeon]|nr:hypothetical protein [Candidatus Nanoarchaeia archaeon]
LNALKNWRFVFLFGCFCFAILAILPLAPLSGLKNLSKMPNDPNSCQKSWIIDGFLVAMFFSLIVIATLLKK